MIINILIGFIAFIHVYILWLEMFGWTTRGKKVFTKFDDDFFEKTKSLAANQGLYNGFLAAGLIWTFFITDSAWKEHISIFFLSCVAIAGIYGALTADRKILFVQTIPAVITLILLFLNR
jgi:putative membrane protein